MNLLKFTAILFILTTSGSVKSQTMLSPLVCHDESGYLKTYNDGRFPLYFKNGNFQYYLSIDSSVKFDNETKTLFIEPSKSISVFNDTTSIVLDKHFMLIQMKNKIFKIDSGFHDMGALEKAGFQVIIEYSKMIAISFTVNNIHYELKVSFYQSSIDWEIKASNNDEWLFIEYNIFRGHRLTDIMTNNMNNQFGIAINFSDKKNNRIERLYSLFAERVMENGKDIIRVKKLDTYYDYNYDKMGKLIKNKTIGQISVCE